MSFQSFHDFHPTTSVDKIKVTIGLHVNYRGINADLSLWTKNCFSCFGF